MGRMRRSGRLTLSGCTTGRTSDGRGWNGTIGTQWGRSSVWIERSPPKRQVGSSSLPVPTTLNGGFPGVRVRAVPLRRGTTVAAQAGRSGCAGAQGNRHVARAAGAARAGGGKGRAHEVGVAGHHRGGRRPGAQHFAAAQGAGRRIGPVYRDHPAAGIPVRRGGATGGVRGRGNDGGWCWQAISPSTVRRYTWLGISTGLTAFSHRGSSKKPPFMA